MKNDKGIYCDLCENFIIKYELDLPRCGVTYIEDKIICCECSKEIAKQLIGMV